VLLKCGYDGAKADIWSCGVILFVLMAGYLPFNDTNLVLLYRKIAQSNYRCPPWFSIDARKLLARLLDPNPRTRITMSKLKAHPWLQKGPCPLTDKHLVTSETTSVLLGNKEACKCHHHRDEEDEEDARERKRSKVTVSSPTIAVRPSSMNTPSTSSRDRSGWTCPRCSMRSTGPRRGSPPERARRRSCPSWRRSPSRGS
jgi:5'-AMP-activated protein kinase catalytic alpha subunit